MSAEIKAAHSSLMGKIQECNRLIGTLHKKGVSVRIGSYTPEVPDLIGPEDDADPSPMILVHASITLEKIT